MRLTVRLISCSPGEIFGAATDSASAGIRDITEDSA